MDTELAVGVVKPRVQGAHGGLCAPPEEYRPLSQGVQSLVGDAAPLPGMQPPVYSVWCECRIMTGVSSVCEQLTRTSPCLDFAAHTAAKHVNTKAPRCMLCGHIPGCMLSPVRASMHALAGRMFIMHLWFVDWSSSVTCSCVVVQLERERLPALLQ